MASVHIGLKGEFSTLDFVFEIFLFIYSRNIAFFATYTHRTLHFPLLKDSLAI